MRKIILLAALLLLGGCAHTTEASIGKDCPGKKIFVCVQVMLGD